MIKKFIALLVFILTVPVYLILSLIVIINDGFPLLYKQKCYGKNNKVFNLLKFRTMRKNTPQIPTEDFTENHSSKYLLNYSSFFRNLSLDELPQIYNVIKGDINFVGPRPCMFNNEEILNGLREEKGINTIKPGITGWAQINGRDQNSFKEKAEFDYYYYKNRNMKLDLYIIYKTFSVVLLRKNIKH
ncbi:MAG: sugar transferase [Candidatus Neomarinimicrobiota bacterium]